MRFRHRFCPSYPLNAVLKKNVKIESAKPKTPNSWRVERKIWYMMESSHPQRLVVNQIAK